MKLDVVTQWVTVHSEKLCTFLQGLPLALGRMDQAFNLSAELASEKYVEAIKSQIKP
jgi:hypothetical protein